jgi:hypothetical protein
MKKIKTMAIAIKSVPVLKRSAAVRFDSNAKASVAKKSSVNFSRQVAISSKILAKAKL